MSGNPSGRPAEIAAVKALARAETEKSIKALVEIRDSVQAPAAARIAAANSLLDRAWGRPSQAEGEDDIGLLMSPELRELVMRLARSIANAKAPVIDAEPT